MFDTLTSNLGHGEVIIYRARYHWIANASTAGTLNLFNAVAVTSHRVLQVNGFFSLHAHSIPATQIESIDLRQSILGRLFGYGDVYIRGSGSAVLELHSIAQPHEFVRKVGQAGTNTSDTKKKHPHTHPRLAAENP